MGTSFRVALYSICVDLLRREGLDRFSQPLQQRRNTDVPIQYSTTGSKDLLFIFGIISVPSICDVVCLSLYRFNIMCIFTALIHNLTCAGRATECCLSYVNSEYICWTFWLRFPRRHTLLRMMIPSWLCSLVVMSNMAPPSPGMMLYSTSAFFPMSKSWALILPTADPTAEDSGTLMWKKPVNKQTSDWTQAHLLSSAGENGALHILCLLCSFWRHMHLQTSS